MRCFYCGREIGAEASPAERNSKWHSKCSGRFFGVSEVPDIQLDEKTLETFTEKSIKGRVTVPGVQKKISLGFSGGQKDRLTMIGYPAGFILKPRTDEYAELPEFEHLAMRMAESAGIKTVPYALVESGGEMAYITKRIDRSHKGSCALLAMEDFC